jgi:hypothetical protein
MTIDNAIIDQHLNEVLKGSGSGLKYYTTQKNLDDMRSAMRAAMIGARNDILPAPLWQYDTNPPPLTDVLISVRFEDKEAVEMGHRNKDGLWCLSDGNVLRVAVVYAWTPLPNPAPARQF